MDWIVCNASASMRPQSVSFMISQNTVLRQPAGYKEKAEDDRAQGQGAGENNVPEQISSVRTMYPSKQNLGKYRPTELSTLAIMNACLNP